MDRQLLQQQIERKLAKFRHEEVLERSRTGWIRLLRKALGMTTRQLAERLGVSRTRVVHIEMEEREEQLTLKSLRQAAEAMNCRLVYVLVPEKPIPDVLRERALQIAQAEVKHVAQSMALENQALTQEQLNQHVQNIVDRLLRGSPKRLWEK